MILVEIVNREFAVPNLARLFTIVVLKRESRELSVSGLTTVTRPPSRLLVGELGVERHENSHES